MVNWIWVLESCHISNRFCVTYFRTPKWTDNSMKSEAFICGFFFSVIQQLGRFWWMVHTFREEHKKMLHLCRWNLLSFLLGFGDIIIYLLMILFFAFVILVNFLNCCSVLLFALDRPYFCRVEPAIFETLYGIEKKKFNKEACR